ncbi:cell wall-binding repeat-containing protein [Buchananella felis]|uniref:cell wall-binding repeat-containing protein n=1 Tax=Buchananella felis TaxID=3231492 RepID=UPI0035294B95
MTITPQGTAAAPITVTDYGEGPERAGINAGGARWALQIENPKYVTVENLELQAPGDNRSMRRGLSVVGTDAGELPHFTARNLYIHNVGGYMPSTTNAEPWAFVGKGPNAAGGIIVETLGSATPTYFTDLVLAGNVIEDVQRQGIYFWSNWCRRPELRRWEDKCHAAFTPNRNVLVTGNRLTNIGGDGIVLHNIVGGVAEHNRLDRFNTGVRAYNAGIWMANAENIVLQYNHVSGGVGNTLDSNAFDIDHASKNVVVRYNLSHNNQGGFLLVCPDPYTAQGYGGLNHFAVHNNVSIDDEARTFMHGCGGSLQGGVIANNTFYYSKGIPRTTVWSDANGASPQVTIVNNLFYAEPGAAVNFVKPADGLIINNNHFTNISAPAGATNNVAGSAAFSGTVGELNPYAYQLATAPTGKSVAWNYLDWAGKLRDYAGRPYSAAGAELGAFQPPLAQPLVTAAGPGEAQTCRVSLTPKAQLRIESGTAVSAAFDASSTCHRDLDVQVGVAGAVGLSGDYVQAQIPAEGSAEVTVPLNLAPAVHDGTYALIASAFAGETPVAASPVELTVARTNPPTGWGQDFEQVDEGAVPAGWTRSQNPTPGVVTDADNRLLRLSRSAMNNPPTTKVVIPLGNAAPKVVSFTVTAKQLDAALGIHLLTQDERPAAFVSLADTGKLAYTDNGTWATTDMAYRANEPLRVSLVLPGDGTYKWFIDGVEKKSARMKDPAANKLRLQIPSSVKVAAEFDIDALDVDVADSWRVPFEVTPQPLPDQVTQFAATHLAPHIAEPGNSAVVVLEGATPGEDVEVTLANGAKVLTAVGRVSADGQARIPVLIPANATGGDYVATIKSPSKGQLSLPKPVRVDRELQIVTPLAPTFHDPEGIDGDKITIPSVEGVVYKLNGKAVTGEVAVPVRGQATVITAEAAEGFQLAQGAQASWSHTYAVAVTPEPSVSTTATPEPSVSTTATPEPSVSTTATPEPSVSTTATPEPSVSTTATPEPSVSTTATPEPSVSTTATPEPSVSTTATPEPVRGKRLAGPDRVVTSLAIWAEHPTKSGVVVLATSGSYADSLAAVPLAAELDAPVVLNPAGALDARVSRALAVNSIKTVYLVGGTGSLSQRVESQVQGLGIQTIRLGGANRFATAAQIAARTDQLRTGEGGQTRGVFLVDGTNFADALSAAPIAAKKDAVILLTDGKKVPAETRTYLNANAKQKELYAVGGKAAKAATSSLGQMGAFDVFIGADRYDTSAKLARRFAPNAGKVGFASGENYPDALTGATLLARQGGVLHLVRAASLPQPTFEVIKDIRPTGTVYFFGGTKVIQPQVQSRIEGLLLGR